MQHESPSTSTPAERKGFVVGLRALLRGEADAACARSLQFVLLAFGS